MEDAWVGGSIGTISEADVHHAATEHLGLDALQLAEFMADLWREYLAPAKPKLSAPGPPPPHPNRNLRKRFLRPKEKEQAP